MASLTQALRTAQSGLLVNQQALNVVSQNIANVNSPGYSRKIVRTESNVVGGIGAGVAISEIARQVDEGLLKSLRIELGELNALTVQENFFDRTQNLFGTPGDNSSLAHIVDDFVAALELLNVSPEKALEQAEVVRSGQNLVQKLRDMSTTIQDLRQQADVEIASVVEEMNKIVSSIDQLNDDIISNASLKLDVSDLKDQRDQQLDQLAVLVDIRFFFRGDGDVVVFTSGGRTLVDTLPPKITHTAASSVASTTTAAGGNFAGIFVGNPEPRNDITDELRGGKLKGLVELRDNIFTNMQSQLDELGAEIRDSLNQIHNRGAKFPGVQAYSGTRVFILPSDQSITFNGTDDTTVALFDGDGNQTAQTTIRKILSDSATTKIDNLATKLQTWLQDNGAANASVAVNSSGRLDIKLNSITLNMSFRDETATASGSTPKDAVINFDANNDGNTDETVSGFSNFFGLNDFFVNGLAENLFESDVLVSSFTSNASTLTFRDSAGLLGGSPLTVAAGLSLTDVARLITNNVTNVTASVIPDGAGVRLRIAHDQGSSMTLTQAGADTFLTDLNMHLADVRVASTLSVRADIATGPENVTRGVVQWNAELGSAGEYFMSIGDGTAIEAMAEAFSSVNAFDTSGGLPKVSTKFSDYAADIVAENAKLADINQRDTTRQRALTDALQFKSDTLRGVNLDEELSSLIIFEQAFTAAARVLAVIQRMFDALERII